jgi:glucosamine--fructose-6-phosphate aminotransferase (isomerizing)
LLFLLLLLLLLLLEATEVNTELSLSLDFLFLGRGRCYPIALEGALKLKEISYIHAEGYPAGEMKHGPIALIDENMPVVMILQREKPLFEKTLSNLKEVEARGARVIVVTDASEEDLKGVATQGLIRVPFVSSELSPILLNVPLQMLAYHVAVLNGTDVDLPRNLAKSVTVE